MRKYLLLAITPDAHINALNIFCTDFKGIEWLPSKVKDKCPAYRVVVVRETSNGEPYYCQILLFSFEHDRESIAAWLGQTVLERGGIKFTESPFEYMYMFAYE